mmetsp:Transcript_46860/g.101752  ORF Transcript_46860/g.101752 Transcript_46860/m.101752 type:complete len:237 (-) Transcript_46860:1046-1756(-)
MGRCHRPTQAPARASRQSTRRTPRGGSPQHSLPGPPPTRRWRMRSMRPGLAHRNTASYSQKTHCLPPCQVACSSTPCKIHREERVLPTGRGIRILHTQPPSRWTQAALPRRLWEAPWQRRRRLSRVSRPSSALSTPPAPWPQPGSSWECSPGPCAPARCASRRSAAPWPASAEPAPAPFDSPRFAAPPWHRRSVPACPGERPRSPLTCRRPTCSASVARRPAASFQASAASPPPAQ